MRGENGKERENVIFSYNICGGNLVFFINFKNYRI